MTSEGQDFGAPRAPRPSKSARRGFSGPAAAAEEFSDPIEPESAPVAEEGDLEEVPEEKGLDWVKIGLSAVAALLFIGAAVVLLMQLFGGGEDLRDMDGNRIEPDRVSPNNEEFYRQADLQELEGARFIVEQLSLDVPYGEVNEVGGIIDPPNYRGVFRVRNRGVDLDEAAQGTVYLATHSIMGGGRAPGNYLMNIYDHTWSLQPGDVIDVNGTRYITHSYLLVGNQNLGSRPELWQSIPGRVVLITCMQSSDYSTPVENLIIIAYLDGYAP